MKVSPKRLIIAVSVLAVLAAAAAAMCFKFTETVYNVDGESRRVITAVFEKHRPEGWYEVPVMTMYSTDGRAICAEKSRQAEFEDAGWYSEPVTLLYGTEGKQMYVKQSELEGYKNSGWTTEPKVSIYAADGVSMNIPSSETEIYLKLGWSTVPPQSEGLEDLKSGIAEYLPARGGEWGVYTKNLDTNEYLVLNEKQYSSASLIKLFTMAAVYQRIEEGTLSMDPEIQEQLSLMIKESSNKACNYLVRRLGDGDAVEGFKAENSNTEALGCSNTQHMSDLIGEKGEHAVTIGYNRTSPADCGLVLERIYRGCLVSEEADAEMLELLKGQTRTWKIPESLPEGTVTANKTGETNTVQGDAAIVYSPSCDYVICVIGNGSVGTGVETIQHISRMTYDYFNK